MNRALRRSLILAGLAAAALAVVARLNNHDTLALIAGAVLLAVICAMPITWRD